MQTFIAASLENPRVNACHPDKTDKTHCKWIKTRCDVVRCINMIISKELIIKFSFGGRGGEGSYYNKSFEFIFPYRIDYHDDQTQFSSAKW